MKLIKLLFQAEIILFSGILFSQTFIGDYSAPSIPKVFATVQHEKVYLTWNNIAESSIDSVTGYREFEGYRIYKSTDSGQTWGGVNARLYNYNGNFIGWKPYAQFDLSEDNDVDFCIYDPDCLSSDPKRGEEISGPDPLNPRINLGENSGLQYTFVDTNVFDGIEYTYSITSYDVGLRTFSVEYVDEDSNGVYEADTTWSESNPDHFIGPDTLTYYDLDDSLNVQANPTRGFPSLECPRGTTQADNNFVTVIPGYFASNITFPEDDDAGSFFVDYGGNTGTGDISYIIADTDSLTDEVLKFEIQADLGATAVEGMAADNPLLYVYEIDDSLSQTPVEIDTIYAVGDLDSTQIDSLMDLPGADSSNAQIQIPKYIIISELNEVSDLLAGIRYQFENLPETIAGAGDDAFIESVDFSIDSLVFAYYDINLKYFNSNEYKRRLNFDYKIEFSTDLGLDTALSTTFPQCTLPALPFKITNMSTGKKVQLSHADWGAESDQGNNDPSLGMMDCIWTRNEELTFTELFEVSGEDTYVSSFKLRLDYDVETILPFLPDWESGKTYEIEDGVYYKAMIWEAVSSSQGVAPSATDEDNPWILEFPWDEGDSVIIHLEKFFVDGDSWVVDMSKLGKPHEVTQDELEQVTVVPNPYIVHSLFNETPNNRKLRFTHLPQQCRISIYTITGELVTSFEYDERYEGNAWWNLRSGNNQNGNEVSPGLYIFLIETDDLQQIGKFAIVR
tara:strand:+ start:6384 stop:8582 length:2199 start_codon:yes stop_codon:yes gene_type:complete